MTRKRLVPILSTGLVALAVPAFAQTVAMPEAAPRQESSLTRDLNSGPPAPVRTPPPRPAEATVVPPASVPETTTPATSSTSPMAEDRSITPEPVVVTPQESSLTRDLNSGPPARVAPPVASPPPSRPNPVPPPTRAPDPVVRSEPAPIEPVRSPPVTATPAPVAAPPVVAAPVVAAPVVVPAPPDALGPTEIAALPFRIDLPPGFRIVPRPAGPDAHVYSVRRGDLGFVTVYAGPAAQFPIYDGQMVQAGGRASVIVIEDGRRHALEHLFQRAVAPHEIHIWVASLESGDRDLAERIAQTIEVR